jgi:hypothetical protein
MSINQYTGALSNCSPVRPDSQQNCPVTLEEDIRSTSVIDINQKTDKDHSIPHLTGRVSPLGALGDELHGTVEPRMGRID